MLQHNGLLPTEAEARAEMAAVLASSAFVRSPRMSHLLTYLCSKYFAGESDRVKEYNIAVEVLGRPETFDPAEDAIARVEVHRLRKKLRDYYENSGAGNKIRIVIAAGSYVPAFVFAEESATPVAAVDNPDMAMEIAPAVPKPAVAARTPRRKIVVWALLGCAVALVLTLMSLRFTHGGRGAPATAAPPRATAPVSPANAAPAGGQRTRAATPVAAAAGGRSVRILCGQTQPHIDRLGQTWAADRYYYGGSPYSRPHHYLARTWDTALYDAGRMGSFSYDIPLQSGTYELRLHFTEPTYGPGTNTGGGENSRVFNVMVNGVPILRKFDIISDAQGPDIADVRVFTNIEPAADGKLHLAFMPEREQAIISSIEVIPASKDHIAPIRITTQDESYTDAQGNVWMPDNYWTGGQIANHAAAVTNTHDPNLFRKERYGNFSYAIPVADGTYNVTLQLAETYWGMENQGGGGAGTRLFDIYCNGIALARSLDIYKQAGANRALVEHYNGLHPNAQGKLILSFVPVKNYASVFAIEVTDAN